MRCAPTWAATMWHRWLVTAGLLILAALAVLLAFRAPAGAVTPAGQQRCATQAAEAAILCIPTPLNGTGLQITDNHGTWGQLGTPLMVTDRYGAPMMWVNASGLYSGGDGRPKDGGEVCVTYGVMREAACLTPAGDLVLTATGPHGQGRSVTLTPADIRFLHRLEKRDHVR